MGKGMRAGGGEAGGDEGMGPELGFNKGGTSVKGKPLGEGSPGRKKESADRRQGGDKDKDKDKAARDGRPTLYQRHHLAHVMHPLSIDVAEADGGTEGDGSGSGGGLISMLKAAKDGGGLVARHKSVAFGKASRSKGVDAGGEGSSPGSLVMHGIPSWSSLTPCCGNPVRGSDDWFC